MNFISNDKSWKYSNFIKNKYFNFDQNQIFRVLSKNEIDNDTKLFQIGKTIHQPTGKSK